MRARCASDPMDSQSRTAKRDLPIEKGPCTLARNQQVQKEDKRLHCWKLGNKATASFHLGHMKKQAPLAHASAPKDGLYTSIFLASNCILPLMFLKRVGNRTELQLKSFNCVRGFLQLVARDRPRSVHRSLPKTLRQCPS